jgi:hypothetical protein
VFVKKIVLAGIFLVVAMLTWLSPVSVPTVAADTWGPVMDETVVKQILEKTYATTMIFNGNDEKWDCICMVRETIWSDPEKIRLPQLKIIMFPKFTYCKYYIRHFDYVLTTSKGCITGERWLHSGEPIIVETTELVPEKAEMIPVKISEWYKTSLFEIVNIIPDGILTPEQAFRKACTVYYQTYATYPQASFLFMMEFVDQEYWLVSWDDNDGIGGQSFLLVNAFTGETGEIKVDEG